MSKGPMVDDAAKSQAQLIAELEALRRRVRELEACELEHRRENPEADQQKTEVAHIQLLEQTRKVLTKTELLYQTARSFIALKSLPELLQLVVDHVAETVSADRVRLVLVDLPAHRITDLVDGGPWVARFPTPPIDETLFETLWNGLVGWTLREGQPVLSPKGSLDSRETLEIRQRRDKFEVGSVMVVPLEYHHKIQGAMSAIKHHDKPDFTPEDLELMMAVANHAALAIENSHLFQLLQDSETRYRRLVELSPDGIIIHTEGKIQFVNPAGAKLHGAQDASEIIGKSIFDFIPPPYQSTVRQRHQQALKRKKRAPSSEQKIYRLDGSLMDIEVTSLPTSYRGQPAIQTIMRDITGRKRLQLELARFRAMMDQSGEGIFVVDPQTSRFIDVNETACRLLGYTREELCQLTVMDTVLEENYTLVKWQQRAEQIKQAKSPLRLSRIYIHKDGTTFPVEVIVSHRNFEGQDYILAVARDMREQIRLETQLRQAQKMEAVGQLAAGVAHNFNNMLTAIMGYVGLALESLPEDHPVVGDLEGVQKTAQRAANLTQQLLAFTRNQIIQPRPLNLNELVINMNRLLRQLISEMIALEISPALGLGLVKIDPGQFEQVLVNLVVNARDAMPQGGKLTIATANVTLDQFDPDQNIDIISGDYVCLSVTDTGSGMTPEVREHIFEPFFTTKEVGKGTGLGLATCFGIVKQNHGYIVVQSEPGQGTTFEIYLPRLQEEITPILSAGETSYPLAGTETILLVEDEPAVRDMISRVLHRYGYTVLEAAQGQEAIQLAASLPGMKIHLLMTDVIMPGLNGNELASHLKSLFPYLKTLFISGYTDNIIAPHGVLEPGGDFLPKPFTPLVLAQKVRQILDNN